MNPLRSMVSNDSKPFQTLIAHKFGFKIPRTLITSAPEEALRFREQCDGKIIYKPIGSSRSIVKLLEPSDLERLELIRKCPVQFQEYLHGINVRVHVVGEEIFCAKVYTKKVDYRYSADRFETISIPKDLEKKCIDISHYLGLYMTGIDFIEQDGEYYCLEVNPSPAFSFYELNAFQPISSALANLLKDGKKFFIKYQGSMESDMLLSAH